MQNQGRKLVERVNLRDLDKMDVHPMDEKGNSTSFARGDVREIAYKLPEDEDFSYINADSEDDEIADLVKHLAGGSTDSAAQISELLKNVRDEMQENEPKAPYHLGM